MKQSTYQKFFARSIMVVFLVAGTADVAERALQPLALLLQPDFSVLWLSFGAVLWALSPVNLVTSIWGWAKWLQPVVLGVLAAYYHQTFGNTVAGMALVAMALVMLDRYRFFRLYGWRASAAVISSFLALARVAWIAHGNFQLKSIPRFEEYFSWINLISDTCVPGAVVAWYCLLCWRESVDHERANKRRLKRIHWAAHVDMPLSIRQIDQSPDPVSHHVPAAMDGVLLQVQGPGWGVHQAIAERIGSQADHRIIPYIETSLTGKQIAAELGLSQSWVKQQLGEVYKAFGVHSRSEARQVVLRIKQSVLDLQ